ncbi:sorting nexin-25 isoform X1 [Photinus pyralis]|uniref:sorting nexin-25 isoform X1 n=1 Tax=Photinus pyralis TaxID=7054 RepID=UPI0012674435|nr:sorting nexin-25 isoform X1 [Photinus pyralis]
MSIGLLYAAIVIGCLGILYSPICLASSVFSLLNICMVGVGICGIVWIHVLVSSPHKTGMGIEGVQKDLEKFSNKLMNNFESVYSAKTPQNHLPVIFGRTIDSLLQQLLDYIMRDFVFIYLKDYAYEPNVINDNMKEDVWSAIHNLYQRLSRTDHVKLIACDLVNKITNHFEKIRDAKLLIAESNHPPLFTLAPHLVSYNKELEYLQNVSEVLIMFLFPRSYSLSPAKYFLREVLACKVFFPFVDHITDPDYFNQKVIIYIEAQKVAAAMHRRTFEYANSFEEFLKMVQRTNDIEMLKSIRYDIVTKIMQATTLQNINRARGVDADLEKTISSNINKSELNAAKKLKRYINQLTYAKLQLEKRLANLGWDINFQMQNDVDKILPLSSILEHLLGRKYLSQFLETVASQGLIGYWSAVEELRTAPRKNRHQLGAEIFYTFIRNPTGEIKVDKTTRKRMEAFLLGDKGPDVFYEVQQQVVQTLEDKYYQPFIISRFYKEMIAAIMDEDNITETDSGGTIEERQLSGESASSLESSLHVGDHSNYAKRKLDQLQEKLNNKMQALQALRSSLKPESRVLKILEKEVEWLEGEKRQVEAHISRTETWGENLGKWRAIVQSADIGDEKEPPQFVIVVHMVENESIEGEEGISTGWVVSRTLSQFQELHRKLRPLCSNIKNVELPSQPFKFLFGKSDKMLLEKAKVQIQKYLEFVLEDDRLNQSEAIYSFLSPSSEHLKHSTPSPKKSKFSFSTLFKGNSSEQGSRDSQTTSRQSEDDNISQCLDAPGGGGDADYSKFNGNSARFLDDNKDTIAEPIYSLMSEIFDMRGVFKYLRKTLIAFVQVTYGRTINRQIRDTIAWCFSEQMLHYYITLIIKSWWPSGTLVKPSPERAVQVKMQTKNDARKEFNANVPEILNTLVGTSAAKLGANKVFDTLQIKTMNKQLFYIYEMALEAGKKFNQVNHNID